MAAFESVSGGSDLENTLFPSLSTPSSEQGEEEAPAIADNEHLLHAQHCSADPAHTLTPLALLTQEG